MGNDWIDLAVDRDRWRALLNAVMNLRVIECRCLLISLETVTFSSKTRLRGVIK